MSQTTKPTLVIGVGNFTRGDDAAGLLLAQRIAAENLPGVQVREAAGDGTELLQLWEGADSVILVDAVSAGGAPGTLYRLASSEEAIPSRFFNSSTHNFGLAEAVELARALGTLPPRLVVFGVEGKQYDPGAPLSPEVEQALEPLLEQIRAELRG